MLASIDTIARYLDASIMFAIYGTIKYVFKTPQIYAMLTAIEAITIAANLILSDTGLSFERM